MTEATPVVLSKITVYRTIVQLEYLCDRCYENPRLKRKHKTHLHGGGNANDECFKTIDWTQPQSFGTRVRHCTEPNLPEVELMYDPDITQIPFPRS